MLTLYFFIPLFTLVTMWQTVPLLLAARATFKTKFRIGGLAKAIYVILIFSVTYSSIYAFAFGTEPSRAVIRVLFYAGMLGLISFGFEMGARADSYAILLKGLAVLGALLAAYGIYQITASYLGLPFRGILRGGFRVATAFEAGLPRINSLASEPKRLGYVLLISSISCYYLAKADFRRLKYLIVLGVAILGSSVFTFSGSYFAATALSAGALILIYGRNSLGFVFGVAVFVFGIAIAFQETSISEALFMGFDRRADELEVGLDGKFVYRQEFFAWDYLVRFPHVLLYGVGMGQYNSVFSDFYGFRAGVDQYGNIIPLNSNALELVFDFGLLTTIGIYFVIALLVHKLRRAGEDFFCVVLVILTMQSFTILTMHFIALFVGLGGGRLWLSRRRRQPQTSHPGLARLPKIV